MGNNDKITLQQPAIISHRLAEEGKKIDAKINGLNIGNLVASDDTIQSLKKTRAELNRLKSDYAEQFKSVINLAMGPINQAKAEYKQNIPEKIEDATKKLSEKITNFESEILAKKEASVKAYFNELCQSEGIDFVPWEKTGIKIMLSVTEKKYKEQVLVFVDRIKDDLGLIKAQAYKVEILAEYKKTLNASNAVTSVTDRKNREKAEADRLAAVENKRRCDALTGAGLEYDNFSKTYHVGDMVVFDHDYIMGVERREFEIAVADFSEEKKPETSKTGNPTQQTIFGDRGAIAAPIGKPEEKKPEAQKPKLFRAVFEVTGTKEQLMSLGKYMRDDKIIYKNID